MNRKEQTAGGFEISSTLFMFLKSFEKQLSQKLDALRFEHSQAEKNGGDTADLASNTSISSEIMVLEKKLRQVRSLLGNIKLTKKVYPEQSIEAMTGNGILIEVAGSNGIKTEKTLYLLGCTLHVHLKDITILTLNSPIAETLKGRKTGSKFGFRNKTYTIKEILPPSKIERTLIQKIKETFSNIFEEEMVTATA